MYSNIRYYIDSPGLSSLTLVGEDYKFVIIKMLTGLIDFPTFFFPCGLLYPTYCKVLGHPLASPAVESLFLVSEQLCRTTWGPYQRQTTQALFLRDYTDVSKGNPAERRALTREGSESQPARCQRDSGAELTMFYGECAKPCWNHAQSWSETESSSASMGFIWCD